MINRLIFLSLFTISVLIQGSVSARANVYASNIKLNGSLNNTVLVPGTCVTISYILNEPASGGVTVDVLQGTNVVHEFTAAPGNPGTLRGFNSFVWDGTDSKGLRVPDGIYGFSITAASTGYAGWTQITDDKNPGNIVWDPYGIAVNKNTNSPYYGRVFVGNSMSIDNFPGQKTGIYIFNSDASPSDEGGFTTSDYQWKGFMASPWKMEVGQDDKLYVADCSQYGEVLAFDQNVSTYLLVLSNSNWPAPIYTNFPDFRGPFVTWQGSNEMIWMADINSNRSSGIIQWPVSQDGIVPPENTGKQVVAAGPGTDLVFAPWDMAVDAAGNIFTVQRADKVTDPTWRVLRYSPPTGSSARTRADWKINGLEGWTDPFSTPTNVLNGLYGVAVSPDNTLLAVASRGIELDNGGVVILDAETGTIITNLTQGPGSGTSYMDVCWDRVGNVYGTQEEIWKAFSPPGTNQSTTIAVPVVQLIPAITPPILEGAVGGPGQFQFTLTGQSNVTYLIEACSDLANWNTVATNFNTQPVSIIQTAPPDDITFYRVRVQPLPEIGSGVRR